MTAPVWIWAAQNNWDNILFQLEGRHQSSGLTLKYLGEYLGGNLLLRSPPLCAALVVAWWLARRRLRLESERARRQIPRLAAALTRFEEFELIDPDSAFAAIADKGAPAAGQALGATYVLQGSLQCALVSPPSMSRAGSTPGGIWRLSCRAFCHPVFFSERDGTGLPSTPGI